MQSMRALIVAIVFLAALLPLSVQAETLDSAQFQSYTIVMVPVKGNFGLCLAGQMFKLPSAKVESWYYYAGPSWTSEDQSLCLMPMFGQVTNRGLKEQDAAIYSLWGVWQPSDQFKVLGQGDLYTYDDEKEYLGWLTSDYFLTKEVSCGFHIERNVSDLYTDTTIGPHLGVTKGPCRLELQWHGSTEGKTHAVRLYTELLFF